MSIVQNGILYEKNIGIDHYKVVGGDATNGKIIIPEKFNGYPVVGIDIDAFKGNDSVVEVHIPDSLMFIRESAFHSCKNLKHIVVYLTMRPSKKIEIGRFAFAECSQLTSVSSMASLILYEYTFYNCKNLTRLNATVSYCSNSSFKNCRLLSQIVFDDDAHWVHSSFCDCDGLKTIIFNGGISKNTLKSRSSMKALYDKNIVCHADSPCLDLIYDGFKIKII